MFRFLEHPGATRGRRIRQPLVLEGPLPTACPALNRISAAELLTNWLRRSTPTSPPVKPFSLPSAATANPKQDPL